MTLHRFVPLGLVLALLAAGCAGPSGPAPASDASGQRASAPKRIVAAINSNPPTISSDNIVSGSGTYQGGDALEELLNAGLTHTDERGSRRPQIADAVPTVENGLWKLLPDGRMETTWTIRPNAFWHDGTPITSADLTFVATISRDKELPVFGSRQWNYVESVEAPDARTITVRWNTTYIRADALFDSLRPKHILGATYENEKLTILQHPYWNEQYIGAGPFRLKEWVLGSHLIMAPYDSYVFGRPRIDEITIKFIPDANALMANILAGEVELTLGRNLSLQQSMQLREHWKAGDIDIGFSNWIAMWPQFLNPSPQILANVQFRRALLHALNRQEMVDVLLYGVVPPAHTFVSPTEAVYKTIEPSIVKYEYEPRTAIQMIEGLGFTRGTDGIFRDAAARPLTLEVRTSGGDDTHEAGILSVADYFRRAGIAAEPFLIPQAQRDDRQYNAEFPGVRLWRQNNDIWQVDRYHSGQATTAANRFSGGNRSRYMNPEFDAFIEKYMVTTAERERAPLLAEIVHHMTDQVTILDLWYNTEAIAVGARLLNVVNKKTSGANQAWNAHEWDVR